MLARLLLTILARRLVSSIARRHGDVAGAALGAALASRRTRMLGLGGAAALTGYEMLKARRERERLPAPGASLVDGRGRIGDGDRAARGR